MAITLENIKFYPPSLPVRPTRKCPANRPSPLYYHSPNRTNISIPTPQPWSLPPRPPVTIPPSTTSQPGNTPCPLSSPVYLNDFDRAIQDFPQESAGVFTQVEARKDEEKEDPLVPDGQVNGGNLPCGTPSSEQDPSSLTTSSTSPTTDNTLARSPNADLVQPQHQNHEISEVRTGNIEPMSPTRPITPSVSSEDLVTTFVSTDLRLNDASPQFPTPGPISTREGKAERHENSHTSVILDSQDVEESSVQSVPHNEEAHQQDTSTVSEQDTTCQPDASATVQGNEPTSVSSLPSIAVVMPVSSRSPTTWSKRTLSSKQCDLEPLLREDDYDLISSDDEDDADYIDDDDIPEADQRPPASKRRKISARARSSPISRETRLSKNLC
ncbi:uncharacterized protein TRUGW13939_04833 [Talaromyces rugulosus]|uniref:Uncharacterized protein n=1 Tax=Talaromyces rugulosus TaxID=121627 RepID=A0A7H8QW50_TALRU|nr:uncharacterized protein TRUGW13939_04833 [Talaromyces rugulosus]QKX57715.1 hypothetical protein TRUGW13939_04833 [Talaromyces rugulosus]